MGVLARLRPRPPETAETAILQSNDNELETEETPLLNHQHRITKQNTTRKKRPGTESDFND
jgi:hypothetical protein